MTWLVIIEPVDNAAEKEGSRTSQSRPAAAGTVPPAIYSLIVHPVIMSD